MYYGERSTWTEAAWVWYIHRTPYHGATVPEPIAMLKVRTYLLTTSTAHTYSGFFRGEKMTKKKSPLLAISSTDVLVLCNSAEHRAESTCSARRVYDKTKSENMPRVSVRLPATSAFAFPISALLVPPIGCQVLVSMK